MPKQLTPKPSHFLASRISRKICLLNKRAKSLGLKQDEMNEEVRDIQALENLTDDAKQLFIHDYRDQLH